MIRWKLPVQDASIWSSGQARRYRNGVVCSGISRSLTFLIPVLSFILRLWKAGWNEGIYLKSDVLSGWVWRFACRYQCVVFAGHLFGTKRHEFCNWCKNIIGCLAKFILSFAPNLYIYTYTLVIEVLRTP